MVFNYMEVLPFVSVIVPTFNAGENLDNLIERLSAQSYPPDRFEVIVVDDGSSDCSIDRLAKGRCFYDSLNMQIVRQANQGSYAARNSGIMRASGEILVFTDSDCSPVETWLEDGVRAMLELGADLIGGHVCFTFMRDRPNCAEIVDSTTNMQVEFDVKERKAAKTANLFVRRPVFDAVGLFPQEQLSGADVVWTQNATKAGFTLRFCKDAKVLHPARSWFAMVSKQIRVGIGQTKGQMVSGKSLIYMLTKGLYGAKGNIESRKSRRLYLSVRQKVGYDIALIVSRASTFAGRIWGITFILLSRQKSKQ